MAKGQQQSGECHSPKTDRADLETPSQLFAAGGEPRQVGAPLCFSIVSPEGHCPTASLLWIQ